jgi:CHAD domain-containing protein/HD superfamily phosphodiesterase
MRAARRQNQRAGIETRYSICARYTKISVNVTTVSKTTGLRYWMLRVLEECDRASAGFRTDPVHDLRVALRRCRSLADGMMAMDPDPNWKAMKKAGKRLFQSLGELRDVQIMMEWIDKLHPAVAPTPGLEEKIPVFESADSTKQNSAADHRDSAARALLHILHARELEQKHAARAALEEFDRKQWRQWSKSLPVRAGRIRAGSAVFKHLALERWTEARELHKRAMRNRSQVALHMLRIGIKRFRYIVENFLPAEHKVWSNDLKHMQDLLGEVHDLDLLWARASSCHVFPNEASRKAWRARIVEERTKRVEEYRQRTTGPDSLWNVWRAGLPQGRQIQQIATWRMKLWAKALDPDFAHSERVARLALELYDGLGGMKLRGSLPESTNGSAKDLRSTLYIAALLHDVGKAKGEKGHHKETQHLIQTHPTPLGWDAETMRRAAVVARFHAGALPSRGHKALRDLLSPEQRTLTRLAAILRLANAFDAEHRGQIRRVRIESPAAQRKFARATSRNGHKRTIAGLPLKSPRLGKNEALVIEAEGYQPASSTAQAIAAERFLLETVLRSPIVVKRTTTNRPAPNAKSHQSMRN